MSKSTGEQIVEATYNLPKKLKDIDELNAILLSYRDELFTEVMYKLDKLKLSYAKEYENTKQYIGSDCISHDVAMEAEGVVKVLDQMIDKLADLQCPVLHRSQ